MYCLLASSVSLDFFVNGPSVNVSSLLGDVLHARIFHINLHASNRVTLLACTFFSLRKPKLRFTYVKSRMNDRSAKAVWNGPR